MLIRNEAYRYWRPDASGPIPNRRRCACRTARYALIAPTYSASAFHGKSTLLIPRIRCRGPHRHTIGEPAHHGSVLAQQCGWYWVQHEKSCDRSEKLAHDGVATTRPGPVGASRVRWAIRSIVRLVGSGELPQFGHHDGTRRACTSRWSPRCAAREGKVVEPFNLPGQGPKSGPYRRCEEGIAVCTTCGTANRHHGARVRICGSTARVRGMRCRGGSC